LDFYFLGFLQRDKEYEQSASSGYFGYNRKPIKIFICIIVVKNLLGYGMLHALPSCANWCSRQ